MTSNEDQPLDLAARGLMYRDQSAYVIARARVTAQHAAGLAVQGPEGADQAAKLLMELVEILEIFADATLGADSAIYSTGEPVLTVTELGGLRSVEWHQPPYLAGTVENGTDQ